MSDPILDNFLAQQFREGMALANDSDMLTLLPIHGTPPDAYIARYSCTGLIQAEDGSIQEHDSWEVGIRFPKSYLRTVDPLRIAACLSPENSWHPNIHPTLHAICVGKIPPGTSLVQLLYQIHEIITYKKLTMREDDALNKACCAWSRKNLSKFPVDERPLKRRTFKVTMRKTA